MDFEEGEVADASDSESERSPLIRNDDINTDKRLTHFKHSRHHSKRKREKNSLSKPRYSSNCSLSKTNVRLSDHHSRPETDRLKRGSERPSLKDHLSDQEDMQGLSAVKRKRELKRTNSANRHKKRRHREDRFSKPMVQMQCRYFMEGRCSKGESCPFGHDFQPPRKQELCKFYAVGVCSKGPTCLYMHGEFPCKFFHLSGRCNHGDSCKFSHAALTYETQHLLDRVAGPKEFSPLANDHVHDSGRPIGSGGGGLYPGFSDHGDVDYRFGRPRFGHPIVNQCHDPQSPPPHGNCHSYNSNLRPHSIGNTHEPRNLLGPHPPFDFHPVDRMDGPHFVSENHFRVNTPNYVPGPGYPHPHFPMQNVSDGPYPAPNLHRFPPTERALLLRPPLNMMPNVDPNGPPEYARFRAPFGPPRIPVPMRTPFSHSLPSPTDAIVSSELDKMAALLASSKLPPHCTPPSTPLLDPRAQSPAATTKTPNGETDVSPSQIADTPSAVPDISNTPTRRTSLTLSSPELNVVLAKPAAVTSPVATQWRLIQLDMNVKIPYPLMQLSIEDLPHRFDDPRLRGRLTTLRSTVTPTPTNTTTTQNGTEDLGLSTLDSHQTLAESTDKTAASAKRRPVRLQLNEMASTFASTHPTLAANPSTRSGDRSYLDDPRFRRRRIITANSMPSDASQTQNDTVTDGH